MTGVNINKIRHYAPGFNSRTTRLDADTAALIFKAGNLVISQSERLIANVSIKAAMPNDTDGKKRGPENAKSSKYLNYQGVVFDPTAKKQEGQYFKHYVTESERIEALRSPEAVPNWGWLDYNAPTNKLPSPQKAVAKVTRYPVNPKTGAPMKNQGFEPEIKALGKTIGEMNPGGKLAARAAKAMGLVIDALGKFRCPPGTAAANRFTNERGEGCFGISAAQVQNIASSLQNALQTPTDKNKLINSLMAIGVSAAEIRKQYRDGGVEGLEGLASRAGLASSALVGDKAGDASFMSTVVTKIRDRMGATKNAASRMDDARQKKNKIIDDLKTKYGITETDEYLALGEIFKAMGNDPDAPFGADQFSMLFMGGTPGLHEEWVAETTIQMHAAAIARKTGITDVAGMISEYKLAKSENRTTPLTEFVNAAIEREKKFRIGAFKQILVDASENPENYKSVNGKEFVVTVDFSKTGKGYEFKNLNGMAWTGQVYIGSGPAIQGYKSSPPPGYMDLYEATGGDIDDQWKAITEALDGDEKSRRIALTFSTDLAAEYGNGWEDFGAQVAAHEMTHVKQFDAIIDWYKSTYPSGYTNKRTGEIFGDFDKMDNNTAMSLVLDFLKEAGAEQFQEVFGMDIEELIDKRLDALAGLYSDVVQQDALRALQTGDPVAFNAAKNLAFLEIHAELNANRSVGLIGDDPEIDEFLNEFIFTPGEKDARPAPDGLIIPGSESVHWGELIVPGAPPVPSGGELIIPGRKPDVPTDAPGPVKPGKPKRPGTGFSPSGPSLPPGAGVTRPLVRPVSPPKGPRTPKGPTDPFEKQRNGKVPRMIREDRFTNQDIDEHLYGEDGKSGLFAMFRSAKNMRIRDTTRYRDSKKKQLLNDLIDTMGISFEEIEEMALKIQRGESLTPEEKRRLISAVTHLRNGANEFKIKAEEARDRYRNYRGVSTENDFNDRDANYLALEQIQEDIEMYDALFSRVGRGFAPAIHDIITMDENGPYPNRLGGNRKISPTYTTDFPMFVQKQEKLLTDSEMLALDSVSTNPPKSYLSRNSASDLELDLSGSIEMSESFTRHGLRSPVSSIDSDIDIASQAMSGLDKMSLPEDIVVEIEIDIDSSMSTDPGSFYSIPSIQTARIETDRTEGLASLGRIDSASGRVGAGAVGRFLGSSRGRKLIEKAGVDPERADLVQMISEVAIGFSIGGPTGALVPLARRGGRDAGEKALEIMVERGWINQSVAEKITKHGLDRIALEGLPDEILRAAEASKDALFTEDNRRKALEMGTAFQERSLDLADTAKEKASELTDSAREQASEMTDRAREQASELVGRIGDRWRRRGDIDNSDPFASPPDMSTRSDVIPTPSTTLKASLAESGLASTSSLPRPEESREYLNSAVERFAPTPVRSKNSKTDKTLGEVYFETTSYEIGGKKVIFGNREDLSGEDIDAEIVPLNPFKISGLNKDTEEGKKAASDWFFARVAVDDDTSIYKGKNHVEALLYAASRGDGDAKEQLEQLSKQGKKLTENQKQAKKKVYSLQEKEEIASKFKPERLPTVKDLVAVRQISFAPKFDEEGNLLLESASDYDSAVRYELDGKESEERYQPFRKTVHFTINTPVVAHDKWKPGENDYLIVIDFAKLLEANPNSLDNLAVEDTFFTAEPGKPLTVPKGFFTYKKISESDTKTIVEEGMKTLGKGEDFPFEILSEGSGTREHMGQALEIIGTEELDISGGMTHMMHPLYIESSIDSYTKGESSGMPNLPTNSSTAAQISVNSILALADNLNWSDAKKVSAIEDLA